jgi:hypothetical protein
VSAQPPEPTLDIVSDVLDFVDGNWDTISDYPYPREEVDLIQGNERRNDESDGSRRTRSSALQQADKVTLTYISTDREVRGQRFDHDLITEINVDIRAQGGGTGGGIPEGEGAAVEWELLKRKIYRTILLERTYPLKDDTCNIIYKWLTFETGTDTPESREVRDYWRHDATLLLYGTETLP